MRTSQFNMTRAMRQSDEAKETDGNAILVYLVNKQLEDKKKACGTWAERTFTRVEKLPERKLRK